MTLLISNTQVDGEAVDIHVAGNRIQQITPHDARQAQAGMDEVIDGHGTAALPGLSNAHTHTAMALLRSYADDMPLMSWLQDVIWPLEARLSEEDVYWAARLGCLEMIRTGTTFFNDMYWHQNGTVRAALDSGMRACVASVMIDPECPQDQERAWQHTLEQLEEICEYGPRIQGALGPHAIYTVGPDTLQRMAGHAGEAGVVLHMHLSETMGEVESCIAKHGVRPVHYLDGLGVLGSRCLLAHAVHLDPSEMEVLAARQAAVVHNPASNLKLASGGPMRYAALTRAGVSVLIGTDGAASNNNLDLFEELKFASLLAKHEAGDPTVLPAAEALSMATERAAKAFRVESGVLEPGKLADIILIDLDNPFLFPGHALDADLVYSGGGRAVKTTICDGRVLMKDGVIPEEGEIRHEAAQRFRRLAGS